MNQLSIDFARSTNPVQRALDEWLQTHSKEIVSFEGELTQEGWDAGNISGWLSGHNHGVYVVGERAPGCGHECEGCSTTPAGYRTCDPRIKIGVASDMYMRFANLKTGSSYELEVLALMPFRDMRARERELHRILRPYRIESGRKTEWFWNSAVLQDLITEVTSYGAEYSRQQ